MTRIEALELELAARKMVKGTGLNWDEVLNCNKTLPIFPLERRESHEIKLALGIVEGKPVWKGDKLYRENMGEVTVRGNSGGFLKIKSGEDYHRGSAYNQDSFSWNPPKPKTVKPEDHQFLQYVQNYIEANPEVGAHVSDYVAQGIEASRKAQIAKSVDMEIIISFLLRGGRLRASDKEFVSAKLEKWSELCSLNWDAMIKEWKK